MEQIELLAEILIDSRWTADDFQRIVRSIAVPRSNARVQLVEELLSVFRSVPAKKRLLKFLDRNRLRLLKGIRWRRLESFHQASLVSTAMRKPVSYDLDSDVPVINSVGELATWSQSPVWLADWLSNHNKNHYFVKPIRKRSTGIRLLEIPKHRLKLLQRKIAMEILSKLSSHPAAHGFVRQRSAISFVEPHLGRDVVLRMDLQDFFPSIEASRVFGLFRSLGYPYALTQVFTDLCTTTCSDQTLDSVVNDTTRVALRNLYRQKHLPQGAPSSPVIANLIAYRLDCRLSGLASYAGATYTRYADDLLFSGTSDFGRKAKSFSNEVGTIALDEGFRVQFRKTRIMRAATCQTAAGIVINQHTNIPRKEYDRLKAILYNCVRFHPSSQNHEQHQDFRSHLRGKINWVRQLNPVRGDKLERVFNQIRWN
jgi:hypothetical protein